MATIESGHSGISKLVWKSDTRRTLEDIGTLEYALEEPHDMTAWQVGADMHREQIAGTVWSVAEVGQVRVVLSSEDHVGGSLVTTLVEFRQDVPRIIWHIDVSWRESGSRDRGVPALDIGFGVPAIVRLRQDGDVVAVPELRLGVDGWGWEGATMLEGTSPDELRCRDRSAWSVVKGHGMAGQGPWDGDASCGQG